VQEAWPHPSRKFLYVAWSNNQKGAAGRHGVTAFGVDRATGVLQQHGEAIAVPARSVFLTVDLEGKHIIVAYNDPSMLTVHRIEADGRLGAAVPQAAGLRFGVYTHQVRVDPTNQVVISVARGNGPTEKKKEDPGSLQVFGYKDGILTNRATIAPGGGYNFQPRHLEFHPTLPVAYITLERQNKVQGYRVIDGPSLSATPLFTKETLEDAGTMDWQATSAIHAHPNGRFLYVGNRGLGGKGENSIAVYALDARTGEPTRIQNADTRGVHPRTFTLDPSGRLLVVANMQPGSLSVFRIGEDGKLEFARKYDQAGERGLFWVGMF
jgi:6-phosphogluconolactonase